MPTWLRHHEAATYLGMSTWALARSRATGEGPPFYRLGARLIGYRREDLDAWLHARRCQTVRDPVAGPVDPLELERILPDPEAVA